VHCSPTPPALHEFVLRRLQNNKGKEDNGENFIESLHLVRPKSDENNRLQALKLFTVRPKERILILFINVSIIIFSNTA